MLYIVKMDLAMFGKMKRKSVKKSKSHKRKAQKSNPKSKVACDARNMLWLKKSSDKKAHCRKKHNSRK